MFKKLLILAAFLLILPTQAIARTTPDDILREQQEAYQSKLKTYSPQHQQQINQMSQQINSMNKKLTDELERIMVAQGEILDEYQFRNESKTRNAQQLTYHTPNDALRADKTEQARYWITFAHEAVAFQAAKTYVLDLGSEATIQRDVLNEIAELQGDIEGLKKKVINSQQTLKGAISE